MARFEHILAIDPNYADALLGKAMVHLGRNEFDEAIACGKRMVELSPDDILAYTNLSVFYQRAGRCRGRGSRGQSQGSRLEEADRRA